MKTFREYIDQIHEAIDVSNELQSVPSKYKKQNKAMPVGTCAYCKGTGKDPEFEGRGICPKCKGTKKSVEGMEQPEK